MAIFEQWQPTVRVRPSVQLQYRYPVLRLEQYSVEECDDHISNQGPAAEKGVNPEEKV